MRWKRGNRLQLLNESEAPPRIRGIFSEMRERLGLPVVPALYQAYAVFPEFLERHWRSFRPILASRQFFVLGARLAAESYTRAHNYFAIRDLDEGESAPAGETSLSLSQVLDYYQYLDPLLLLITAAQMQAFEGMAAGPGGMTDDARHATFPVAPRLLCDPEATPQVQRIWEERRRILELAFVSDEHRALACWPNFYQQYWAALKSLLQSPLYEDCQYRIGESALRLARELPISEGTTIPDLLEAGLNSEQLSSLVHVNEAFMQAFTGLLLDITFARIGSEGGNRKDGTHPGDGPDEKPMQSETAVDKAGVPTRAA
jgi:hypothetical protein